MRVQVLARLKRKVHWNVDVSTINLDVLTTVDFVLCEVSTTQGMEFINQISTIISNSSPSLFYSQSVHSSPFEPQPSPPPFLLTVLLFHSSTSSQTFNQAFVPLGDGMLWELFHLLLFLPDPDPILKHLETDEITLSPPSLSLSLSLSDPDFSFGSRSCKRLQLLLNPTFLFPIFPFYLSYPLLSPPLSLPSSLTQIFFLSLSGPDLSYLSSLIFPSLPDHDGQTFLPFTSLPSSLPDQDLSSLSLP